MTDESAKHGIRWRGQFLVVDETPELRQDAYFRLAAQTQHFEIETGLFALFPRLLGTSPPYTLVLVPLVATGRLSAPDEFVGDSLERWAARHAPGYLGRFLYYGSRDLVQAAPAGASVVELPPNPSRRDIERCEEAIDAAIERIRVMLKERRKAARQARQATLREGEEGQNGSRL